MQVQLAPVLGLLVDFTGAVFLARGVMSKPFRSMVRENQVGFGGAPNGRYLVGTLEQKSEAVTGVVMLAFGFLLQLAAYLLPGLSSRAAMPRPFLVPVALASCLMIGVFGVAARSAWMRWAGPRLIREVIGACQIAGPDNPGDHQYICELGAELMPWFRRNAEDDATFARRLWDRVGAGGG